MSQAAPSVAPVSAPPTAETPAPEGDAPEAGAGPCDVAPTETPPLNRTEVWEMHNFTEDGHPIHIHQVQFQVVNRQPFGGAARPPEAGENGFKDTVVALPQEITRVKARFDIAGRYVWHCHIIDHEDNEMMRPMQVG